MTSGDFRPPEILQRLVEAEQTPEDRAAIAVKALEFLAIVGRQDVEVVQEYFAAAEDLVESVESAKERDYLRRILLETAQTAFLRPDKIKALDELLDRIEDGDERQNALYARLLVIAKNLLTSDRYGESRFELRDRVEEIEDLRQYEEIVAYLYASDVIYGYCSDDEPPLETATGLLCQYDGAFVSLLQAKGLESHEEKLFGALESALFYLDVVEQTLQTGVWKTGDGEETYDEEELDELRKEASTLVFSSPRILENLPRLYEFAGRCDAFDALLAAIDLLSQGLTSPKSALFPRTADRYAADLYDASFLATKLAGENPSRLVRLVETLASCLRPMRNVDVVSPEDVDGLFSEGERSGAFGKSNSPFSTFFFRLERRAFDWTSKSDSDVERVEGYAALLNGRVRGELRPRAEVFAKNLATELDDLRPTPTRLYHKKRFLSLLLETYPRDEIARLIDSEDDLEFKRTMDAKLAAFDQFKRGDCEEFRLLDDFDVDLTKIAPIVAADEFLDYARFVHRLPCLRQFLPDGVK